MTTQRNAIVPSQPTQQHRWHRPSTRSASRNPLRYPTSDHKRPIMAMPARQDSVLGCPCAAAEREELLRCMQSATEAVRRLQAEIEGLIADIQRQRAEAALEHYSSSVPSDPTLPLEHASDSDTSSTRHRPRRSRSMSPPPPYHLVVQPVSVPIPSIRPSPRPGPGRCRVAKRTPKPVVRSQIGKATRFVQRVTGIAWALWQL